jgi:beta-lactamase class D
VHNPERASQRFSPASTFKIPNTLIALQLGVITTDTVFKWDGTDRGVAQWNADQTLTSAFNVSCVWCYQEIARKAGLQAYTDALARLQYGNGHVGDQVDRFWLNGDLRISAEEQVNFLGRVFHYATPYRRENVDVLQDIMRIEATDAYTLYAKSGWATTTPQVAWYVGFVDTPGSRWFFAMNMQVDNQNQLPLRKELTVKSLRALELIPAFTDATVGQHERAPGKTTAAVAATVLLCE